MPNEIKIHGYEELKRELEGLERKIFNRVVGKAVRAGANVVVKAAKQNAPVRQYEWPGMEYPTDPGNLKKGIGIQRAKRQPRHIKRDWVGFKPKAWYGYLVERGHNIVVGGTLAGGKKRRRTKGQPLTRKGRATTSGQGRITDYIPPHPFLRPAFDNNVQKIIDAMYKKLAEELQKLK